MLMRKLGKSNGFPSPGDHATASGSDIGPRCIGAGGRAKRLRGYKPFKFAVLLARIPRPSCGKYAASEDAIFPKTALFLPPRRESCSFSGEGPPSSKLTGEGRPAILAALTCSAPGRMSRHRANTLTGRGVGLQFQKRHQPTALETHIYQPAPEDRADALLRPLTARHRGRRYRAASVKCHLTFATGRDDPRRRYRSF